MSERYKYVIEEAAPKAGWNRPAVDRMVAGAAEGSADIISDGINNPS